MSKVNKSPERVRQRRLTVLTNMKKNAEEKGPVNYKEKCQKEYERLSAKWSLKA